MGACVTALFFVTSLYFCRKLRAERNLTKSVEKERKQGVVPQWGIRRNFIHESLKIKKIRIKSLESLRDFSHRSMLSERGDNVSENMNIPISLSPEGL